MKGARKLALVVTDGGDNISYDHADWIEPVLSGSNGTLKVSEQKWTFAKAGYGEVRANLTIEGKPVMMDEKVVDGIGTHAVSVIEFDIPAGYDTFKARGILSHSRPKKSGSVEFVVLTDAARLEIPDKNEVSVSFADLGITGKAKVRDLWKRLDLGVFSGRLSHEIPIHGAELFRISPQLQ